MRGHALVPLRTTSAPRGFPSPHPSAANSQSLRLGAVTASHEPSHLVRSVGRAEAQKIGHKTTAWPRPPTFPSLQPPFVRDLIQVEPELGQGEGSLRSAGGDAGACHALTLSPSRPGDAGLARHPPARDGAFHAPGLAHPERERRKKKKRREKEGTPSPGDLASRICQSPGAFGKRGPLSTSAFDVTGTEVLN